MQAAADTQPGNEGTSADGQYLMGALALYTQATVYAATKIQGYLIGKSGTYDFGGREGTRLRFDPNGSEAQAVRKPAYELSEVLVGCV